MIVLTPDVYPLYAMNLSVYCRVSSSPILTAYSMQMAQQVADILNREHFEKMRMQVPPQPLRVMWDRWGPPVVKKQEDPVTATAVSVIDKQAGD